MSSNSTAILLDTLRAHLGTDLDAVEHCLQEILGNERTPLTDEVGAYLLETSGKRIRPILTLLAARAVGGKGEAAASVAAAMECVHMASLLHDDVIDQAPLRRGVETVHQRHGSDVAILMGNYLYSHAFQRLLATSDPRPLQILTNATARMCEGEMFQIQIGDVPVRESEYLRIIADKTAHLIAACTALGAVVGGGDEETINALTQYGLDLGVTYQVTDDSLDFAGSDSQWGKQPGTDLREGKWTLPLIRAMGRASEADRESLLEIWNNGREFSAILEILNRYDTIEECFEVAREAARRAQSHLSAFPSTPDFDFLRALPEFVVSRTH